jgi:hypothetical protein
MNDRQFNILSAALIVIALMAVVPPWNVTHISSGDVYTGFGSYGFVLSPPQRATEICAGALLAQLMFVAGITGLAMLNASIPARPEDGMLPTRPPT